MSTITRLVCVRYQRHVTWLQARNDIVLSMLLLQACLAVRKPVLNLEHLNVGKSGLVRDHVANADRYLAY